MISTKSLWLIFATLVLFILAIISYYRLKSHVARFLKDVERAAHLKEASTDDEQSLSSLEEQQIIASRDSITTEEFVESTAASSRSSSI